MLQIKKKKYTTNLTIKEIGTINDLKENYQIFNSTKLNMMSVLSYLIKHGANLKEGFKKSMKDIWNMYKRYHKNIKSISNFKKIIYKLENVKLIFIEKIGTVNVYHARKFLEVSEEVSTEVTLKKYTQDTDISCLHQYNENTQKQKLNQDYINIIYSTSQDISTDDYKNSLAYKKACKENSKDIVTPVELILMAKKILKEKRRRSEKLFTMVKNSLKDKTKIIRVNADKYVMSVVIDQIAKFELQREMYTYAIAKGKNNYRTVYNISKSNHANFTQRTYDYDKLEKQLLGWDNSDNDYEISTH